MAGFGPNILIFWEGVNVLVHRYQKITEHLARIFFVGHGPNWPCPTLHFIIHFQCPNRKSKTISEYEHTPNYWEIWPQKPLLTAGKFFSHEEK